MFKNPSLSGQPRPPGPTNGRLSPQSVRWWGFYLRNSRLQPLTHKLPSWSYTCHGWLLYHCIRMCYLCYGKFECKGSSVRRDAGYTWKIKGSRICLLFSTGQWAMNRWGLALRSTKASKEPQLCVCTRHVCVSVSGPPAFLLFTKQMHSLTMWSYSGSYREFLFLHVGDGGGAFGPGRSSQNCSLSYRLRAGV